jgi:uncharacterized membrane protein HdeD (DUF308 family)
VTGYRSAATSGSSAPWWTWAISGLLTVGVGVLVLARPGQSIKALAVITGIYLLVDSVMAFVDALARDSENRELTALHGVISLVAGLILVRHPIQGVTAVALVIGISLIAVGALHFVGALRSRDHAVWRSLVGLAQLIAGIVIVATPDIGYTALTVIAGIGLIVQGVAMIALCWSLRGTDRAAAVPSYRAGPAPS